MAQATINSSPYNPSEQYQVHLKPKFWYGKRIQIYPVSPDPDIPAPSMWSVVKKYRVDTDSTDDRRRFPGRHLDELRQRREPPAVALGLQRPAAVVFVRVAQGAALGRVLDWRVLHGVERLSPQQGPVQSGSIDADLLRLVCGGAGHARRRGRRAPSSDGAYMRRFLGYNKPWSNLLTNADELAAADGATVLKFLRQALLLGYFPGAAGEYWKSPAAYERDRALWKKYVPLIKDHLRRAGNPPLRDPVRPGHSRRALRQPDQQRLLPDGPELGTSTTTVQFTLDAAALGLSTGTITVKELVGNTTVSASRSGPNVFFSDTLAAGETTLYEVTQTGAAPPPPLHSDTGPDADPDTAADCGGLAQRELRIGRVHTHRLDARQQCHVGDLDRGLVDRIQRVAKREDRHQRERRPDQPLSEIHELRAVARKDVHAVRLDEDHRRGGDLSSPCLGRGARRE